MSASVASSRSSTVTVRFSFTDSDRRWANSTKNATVPSRISTSVVLTPVVNHCIPNEFLAFPFPMTSDWPH